MRIYGELNCDFFFVVSHFVFGMVVDNFISEMEILKGC